MWWFDKIKMVIRTLITRHEEKMKAPGSIIPGSAEDQRLPLSLRGTQRAFMLGQNNLPRDYDTVIALRSNLVRTTQTLQHALAGAGYDPDDATKVVWTPENAAIGLACGYAFSHSALPPYAPSGPQLDDHIKGLLEGCYFRKGDDPSRPAASYLAASLLDSLLDGITRGLHVAASGGNALVVLATHTPFIDSLDAALFETVNLGVDGKGKVRPHWPGAYATGDFISGYVEGPRDNPEVGFFGKAGSENKLHTHFHRLVSLRDEQREFFTS